MKKPLISVIVPIYNVDKYLDQCLRSIVEQKYNKLEIILVDDGSVDNSQEIIEEYCYRDNRIISIKKENGGLDSARKAGVSVATGDYVGYVDGDDWIEPEMYQIIADLIEKYDADTITVGVLEEGNKCSYKRKQWLKAGYYSGELFEKDIVPRILYSGEFFKSLVPATLWDKVFRRRLLINYQMREGLNTTVSDDTMVTFPTIMAGKSIYISDIPLYHYRIREDSLSHRVSNENVVDEIVKWYKLWDNAFSVLKYQNDRNNQLNVYLIYILALKNPCIFDVGKTTYLSIYGGVDKGSKVVVYGAGQAGVNLVKYIMDTKGVELIAWADRNYNERPDVLCSPQRLKELEFDYLLVAILRRDAYESAKQDLNNIGISESKIKWIDMDIIDNANGIISSLLNGELNI